MNDGHDSVVAPHRLARIRLALAPGVGPKLLKALLARFGTAEDVLAATPASLREVPGVGPKVARAIAQTSANFDIAALLDQCRQHGVRVMLEGDADYPRILQEIHAPPPLLFVRGEILPRDGLAIGVVGTRHATSYGLRMAERLSGSLARAGLTIVSGLARGIDAAAHKAALAAGGRTIAVLGSGVLNVYPPEHESLAEKILAAGALVSESPPFAGPKSGIFPQRNRIISGLSLGVLVIEAAIRSGALITARHATEQGRDVFALPGPADSRASQGCHRLIRDGAQLVETAQDVLDELGPLAMPVTPPDEAPIHHPAELMLNEQERQVLASIDSEPVLLDIVAQRSGLPVQQVLATVSVLEMRRLVERIGGTKVRRK